jgi:phosphatidylserine/phosphatidylglycerophosphate/cardiolipin synthase-like enzyme
MWNVAGRTKPLLLSVTITLLLAAAAPAAAGTLCDPSRSDCRSKLISLIRAEKVGIDVAFWYMNDSWYVNELIKRHQAGVPLRILMDPRANADHAGNATSLSSFKSAGIPMRRRTASGVMHWKTMIFAGQEVVEFGSANYSSYAFVPSTAYRNYTAETVFFSTSVAIVNSFKRKFDDYWVDTNVTADYANVTSRTRRYPTYAIDSRLNFPPADSYVTRSLDAYNRETKGIDVIMFRLTDSRHTDAIIKARNRGVPVRIIVENDEYRNASHLWDAWNTDRLYAAGVSLRWRGHAGNNHEKLVLLRGQQETIFGSSNWTTSSTSSQLEHNYFTTSSSFFSWFSSQFARMWYNSTGNTETVAFKPLPPNVPTSPSPSSGGSVSGTSVTLRWYGGPWAHKYDLYVGTSSDPPLIAANLNLGPSSNSTQKQSAQVGNLVPGRTYYWKVVAKTMANKTATSPVWYFKTAG